MNQNENEMHKGYYFTDKFDILNEHTIDESQNNNSGLNKFSELLSIEPTDYEKIITTNSIERYVCFHILSANLCFKDAFDLLNGDMISDLVNLK